MRERIICFVPFTEIAPRIFSIYGLEYIADEGDEAEEDIGLVVIANEYAVRDAVIP